MLRVTKPIGGLARMRADRAMLAVLAAAFALAACGGDSAGSGASGTGATQNPPTAGGGGGGTATLSVVVSGAIPTSGTGAVTGGAGTSSVVSGTVRRLIADGTGNGQQHRFTVDYDGVTGVVISVTHGWGTSLSALDAATQCVRAATVVGQAVCGDAVSVDLAARRAAFSGAVLRGSGTFTSILTGQIGFTAP
jgi:hypothetical protein